jgi:polysaccharide deacetylase family protein (PEP-CTERM system associated)
MNILTFDIEEWYLEEVLYGGRNFRYKQFDKTFKDLIDELDRLSIKATFFCVGKLAHKYPEVVKSIASHGHEVGCHSNEHTWLNKMDEQTLRRDTEEAVKSIEDVTGQKVVSYRAPAFSITPANRWAINVLAEYGIENDASIFPTYRDLGGYKDFPQDTPCMIEYKGAQIKEYPISLSTVLGKRIAYSGGGYFRVLPLSFIKRTINRRDYNMLYFHLNDLINQKFKLKSRKEYEDYFKEPGTLKNRVLRYLKGNIGTVEAYGKLKELLSCDTFVNIKEADKLIDWDNNLIEL